MQGSEKCSETDDTAGWIREKLSKKVGGEDRVSEGRNEKERGRGDEQKDKRRPVL